MPSCQVHCLGLVPYQQAWDLQTQLAAQIGRGEHSDTLLLLEHPHTYTFGRSGHAANLIWNEAQLKEHCVQVFWVDRGGDVTYHGPGQLVGYPLIQLKNSDLVSSPGADSAALPRADYVGYLRKLEQVLINSLHSLGVSSQRIKNLTGVWVNGAKIASIGVKVDARGVTRHGFALNVSPEMSYWDGIISCGLQGCSVTSLAALTPSCPTMQQVTQVVIDAFADVFELDCEVNNGPIS